MKGSLEGFKLKKGTQGYKYNRKKSGGFWARLKTALQRHEARTNLSP